MIGRLRGLSPRAEKTVRLAGASVAASAFGVTGVAIESEALGWVAAGIILAAILAGPLVARLLAPPVGR